MITFKQFLSEDVLPGTLKALNIVRPDWRLNAVDAHEDPNLSSTAMHGSSRRVQQIIKPHKIRLREPGSSEYKDIEVPVVLKIAKKMSIERIRDKETANPNFGKVVGPNRHYSGQDQNKAEFKMAQTHGLYIPNGDGTYRTNHEKGYLASVFETHPKGNWIMAQHVQNIEDFSVDRMINLTKTETHQGFTHSYEIQRIVSNKKRNHPHPMIRALKELKSKYGFNGDLHSDNIGQVNFHNPATGQHEDRFIIRDPGFTRTIQKRHY